MNNLKILIIALCLNGFTLSLNSGYLSQYLNDHPIVESPLSPLDQLRKCLSGALDTVDTVIVTDIHDVLTSFSITAAFQAFLKMSVGNKLHFTKKTKDYFLHNKSPKRSFESIALSEKGDDPAYVEQAIALMNPHVPKPETVAILEQLQAQGYRIYGSSNIGERSYQYMQDKYPAVFKHLIACRTTNLANGFRKKKDPAAQAYQETLGLIGSNPKRIVVIDDKKENIAVAQGVDARFEGIVFKNPKQLRARLVELNILENK